MASARSYFNFASLTRWVRWVLYSQMLFAAISLLSGYAEYQLLADFQSGYYSSEQQATADAESSDQRQQWLARLYLLLLAFSAGLILSWIYQANNNARKRGALQMEYTPGWAVGYFFIPVLTLWKPYQAMQELWKASKNPSDWVFQTTSAVLPLWWGLWLISNFLGQLIFRSSVKAETIEQLMNLNLIKQCSDLIDIPLALTLLVIVNRIYAMQNSMLSAQSEPLAAGAGRHSDSIPTELMD